MKVVFDTNVFIAAALKGAFAEEIIELAETTDLITLITSEEILSELKQKLLYKFDKSESNVDYFIEKVRNIAGIVSVTKRVSVVTRDPDDNKILECALSGKADLIVTSDQDLIKLKTFRGIGLVHPKTLSWTFPEYFKKSRK
jgi:putative PIN family toxin of toxin-antitoxin system